MNGKDLTHGSIQRNIINFSLPYLLSYFMQILYGLADLFFIGRYCGVDSITAVSIGSQVMHMLTVIIVGLAMGTTVVTAKAVGTRDQKAVAKAIGNTITLFMAFAAVLAVGLLIATGAIVSAMSTPTEAIANTRIYLTVCFIGVPFIVAYNIIASIFRGLGDSKSPMYFIAIACVVNIVLDWLLIGVCGMDAMGAALATTISQTISVAVSLLMIRRNKAGIRITRDDLIPRRDVMGNVLKIGVPVSLQDGFIQIAFLVITIIANERGLNDAAAVGIVEKVIGVLFIIPSAMLSTVSAISAQNIGAGKIARARATLHYATAIAVVFGLVSSFIMQLYAPETISLFTDEPRVIVLGSQYLRSYVWDCVFAGIHFCYSGFFCACGLSIISFIHNVLSMACVRIPMAYITSASYPDTLYPMGWASPAGSLLSVIICVGVYWHITKRGKVSRS